MKNTLSNIAQIRHEEGLSHGKNHKSDLERRASHNDGVEAQTPFADYGIDFERRFLQSLGWPDHRVLEIEIEARNADVGLIQTAIASGALKAQDFYATLSRMLSLAGADAPYRVHLPSEPAETWLLVARPFPIPADGAAAVALNGQTFSLTALVALAGRLGEKRRRLKLLTRQEVIDSVTRSYGRSLVKKAVSGLMRARPEWSAKRGAALWQLMFGAGATGIFLGAALIVPKEALMFAALIMSVFFLLACALRFAAVLNMLLPKRPASAPSLLRDADLPPYTVLVPLFKEVAILPHLAEALRGLDYPAAKLDIKLILESADAETIEAALKLSFPGNVDLIVVPDKEPRTKPKALNYALQFATGDLAVIYDAEDRPEPDQLRKAATAFHHAAPNLACLQARLDYFNASENWLSRQFTIEYATLFRGILPLLSRFSLPLPLGGTSNHFRMNILRKLGAWDPFNVTEDADLGMRLHRAGYRAAMLNSTTYEEACCHSGAWIKQRTRWLKGWMQTFGVHMRSPRATLREMGLAGFLAFQAYFAGIIVAALVHPVCYLLPVYQAWQGALLQAENSFDRFLICLAAVNFAGGYAVNLALGALSLRDTGHKGLTAYIALIPFYWLFVSAAAYRAVWQLIWAPFYWEKTAHGVSKTLKQSVR